MPLRAELYDRTIPPMQSHQPEGGHVVHATPDQIEQDLQSSREEEDVD